MKKKRFVSKETRKKMRTAKLGKKRSFEVIEKIRIATIKAMADPLTKEKMRKAKLGKIGNNKGCKFTKKQKERMSLAHKGQVAWNKGKTNLPKQTREHIEKRISKMRGSKNPSWKGGITPINFRIRSSLEFMQWRKKVFKRDNYTCQKTKIKGGKLCSHHIKNFAEYPESRFKVSNGITLSEKAHRKFHRIYGIKNNTKQQIEEFIKKPLAVVKG